VGLRGGTVGSGLLKSSRVALAIARVEDNREQWLSGAYFELRSRRKLLQDWVGDGGTLWVVVSRPAPGGGRQYSLTFRFSHCSKYTYPQPVKWGQFAVRGDLRRSQFYPKNDARLLLLALRFQNGSPIRGISLIGSSLQTPRLLTDEDVRLIELYRPPTDLWGAFISYCRADEAAAAMLKSALDGEGISVFLDKSAIPPAEEWSQALRTGVTHSRSLVLLIGTSTHQSKEVRKEIGLAQRHGVKIIPISLTGNFDTFPHLAKYQGSTDVGDWSRVAAWITRAIPPVLLASDEDTAKRSTPVDNCDSSS
jgi:hypothetical protein